MTRHIDIDQAMHFLIYADEDDRMSEILLKAAYEQIMQIEDQWRRAGDPDRPLRITTHWYKPAAKSSDNSSLTIACNDHKKASKVKSLALAKPVTDSKLRSAARKNALSDDKAETVRASIMTSRKRRQAVTDSNQSPAQFTQSPSTKPKTSAKQKTDFKRTVVIQTDASEPRIIFREIRWGVPKRADDRKPGVNVKVKRHHARKRSIATTNEQTFSKEQQASATTDHKKLKGEVPQIVGTESVVLALRPARPRSPSRTRPKPKGVDGTMKMASEDETKEVRGILKNNKRQVKPAQSSVNRQPPYLGESSMPQAVDGKIQSGQQQQSGRVSPHGQHKYLGADRYPQPNLQRQRQRPSLFSSPRELPVPRPQLPFTAHQQTSPDGHGRGWDERLVSARHRRGSICVHRPDAYIYTGYYGSGWGF